MHDHLFQHLALVHWEVLITAFLVLGQLRHKVVYAHHQELQHPPPAVLEALAASAFQDGLDHVVIYPLLHTPHT